MNRLVVAFVVFVHLNAMTFIVSDNNPICLEVEGGAEYHIEYIVSGPNQNLLNFTIQHKKSILLKVSEKAEYSGKHELPLGEVEFCFRTVDGYSKSVSLHFEQQHSNQIQTRKERTKLTILEMNRAVEEVKTVYRYQHYQMERDDQHHSILESVQTRVKWGGVVKILTLILAGFLQFWILRRYIGSPPKAYSPVRTTYI